jgi:hypothetical protein
VRFRPDARCPTVTFAPELPIALPLARSRQTALLSL